MKKWFERGGVVGQFLLRYGVVIAGGFWGLLCSIMGYPFFSILYWLGLILLMIDFVYGRSGKRVTVMLCNAVMIGIWIFLIFGLEVTGILFFVLVLLGVYSCICGNYWKYRTGKKERNGSKKEVHCNDK